MKPTFLIALVAIQLALSLSEASPQVRSKGVGCLDRQNRLVPCRDDDSSPRPDPSPDPGGRPSDDYDDQRRRDEAAEAERRRSREEQNAREAAEAAKKQQQFLRDRDAASKTLKGADTIKDQSTPAFGLKGVGDTGIKQLPPDRDTRDVSTAWKQLHCARELSGYALKAAAQKDGPVDLTEVRYLAGEAMKALNGQPVGAKCSDSVPPMPKVSGGGTVDTKKLLPAYDIMLKDVVRQAEKIDAANRELPELSDKEQKAKQRVAELKAAPRGTSQVPTSPTPRQPKNSDADSIAKATAEQKAYQEKERQRIEEVVKAQKEGESARAEAMAVLLDAQAHINQRNADKSRALEVLRKHDQFNTKGTSQ